MGSHTRSPRVCPISSVQKCSKPLSSITIKCLSRAKPLYYLWMLCIQLSRQKLSYGWIRKGQDKLIETTGSRTRLNLIGALLLEDIGATVTETYDTINSESIVRFFWKLKKEHYPLERKVHLVLDGAAYHRTELVKDAAKVLNIDLHYLPPYSPNLNPIEQLWKVMNEHARNQRLLLLQKSVHHCHQRIFRCNIT